MKIFFYFMFFLFFLNSNSYSAPYKTKKLVSFILKHVITIDYDGKKESYIFTKVNHPCKTWRNWLLELCRHQNTNGRKMQHLAPLELFVADNINISVKDASCDEKCFNFVVLLLMKVENFLDSK